MSDASLSPFALFFMLLSMGTVTALTAYCYYRILFAPGSKPPAGDASDGAESAQQVKL